MATVQEGSIIQIYDLGKHHVRHKTELRIEPSRDEYGCRMEVVKMAISSGSRDLAVLYRSWYSVENPAVGPQASGGFNDPTYKLVTFHRLFAKTKGYFYCTTQQEKRDINNSEEEEVPVGLALASSGNACIAWKHPARQSETKIWLVGRDDKLMEACAYGQYPKGLPNLHGSFLCLFLMLCHFHLTSHDEKKSVILGQSLLKGVIVYNVSSTLLGRIVFTFF